MHETDSRNYGDKKCSKLGPFIRENISRGLLWLRLTQDPSTRINGTKSIRSRLIQPTASSSGGLSWTWKCSYKCTPTLSAACWSRERLLRMLFFNYIPGFRGRETRATVAGKWTAVRESRKFRLNSISSIAENSLSNHSIDRWRTFGRGFRTSFATAQHESWPKC